MCHRSPRLSACLTWDRAISPLAFPGRRLRAFSLQISVERAFHRLIFIPRESVLVLSSSPLHSTPSVMFWNRLTVARASMPLWHVYLHATPSSVRLLSLCSGTFTWLRLPIHCSS